MRNLILVLLVLLVIAGLLLLPSALDFRDSLGSVPPGVRLAGTTFGSADAATVARTLETTFNEPVAVYYAGRRLILRPQMVGFTVDVPAMLEEAQKHGQPLRLAVVFLGQVIKHPPRPVEVALHYTLNREALDNWLADVARRYDRPSLEPEPILDRLTIQPGQDGWTLDLPESRDRVTTALTNPGARSADLVVREAKPPRANMDVLRELLEARSRQFPGSVGLFLHDTKTGDEITINAGTAYSGMGTMKIPIVAGTYSKLDGLPGVNTARLISETVTLGGNESANALLDIVGDGNGTRGAEALTAWVHSLGLHDTFVAAPFDAELTPPPHIVTAANSQGGADTKPDPYMQTTPRDMGLLLEMLVECSQGGGTLLAAYPDKITRAECEQALAYMGHNEVNELITQVLPAGTRMAHKQGYAPDTQGDVAAIWGPTGPYVLSIYLYQAPQLDWYVAATTMQELSQAVWNYYGVVASASASEP